LENPRISSCVGMISTLMTSTSHRQTGAFSLMSCLKPPPHPRLVYLRTNHSVLWNAALLLYLHLNKGGLLIGKKTLLGARDRSLGQTGPGRLGSATSETFATLRLNLLKASEFVLQIRFGLGPRLGPEGMGRHGIFGNGGS
jgi:hypothetical protein